MGSMETLTRRDGRGRVRFRRSASRGDRDGDEQPVFFAHDAGAFVDGEGVLNGEIVEGEVLLHPTGGFAVVFAEDLDEGEEGAFAAPNRECFVQGGRVDRATDARDVGLSGEGRH